MTDIILVNASTVLKDTDVEEVAPVLQILFDRDFEPVWQTGLSFKVSTFNNGSPIKVHDEYLQSSTAGNAWPVYLFDNTDTPGAGGYHLDQGVPFGKVFVKDAMDYGESWTVDLTHEYLEIAGDPTTNILIDLQIRGMAGYKCLQEVCDAVEADNLAYTINNTLVSDWCTPEYFYKTGQTRQGRGIYDFKGHLTMPAPALMKGGYLGIQDPNGQWGQVSNFKEEGFQSRRAMKTLGRLNLACK